MLNAKDACAILLSLKREMYAGNETLESAAYAISVLAEQIGGRDNFHRIGNAIRAGETPIVDTDDAIMFLRDAGPDYPITDLRAQTIRWAQDAREADDDRDVMEVD